MDELNSEQIQTPAQSPPQIIERPLAVTVFGVLNIFFGGIGMVCTPFTLAPRLLTRHGPMAMPGDMVWNLISLLSSVGFSVWLLVLGIGLLKLKSWARSGSIGYACICIVLMVVVLGISTNSISNMLDQPRTELWAVISGMCGSVMALIYPILLLFFMLTEKVKRAFCPP